MTRKLHASPEGPGRTVRPIIGTSHSDGSAPTTLTMPCRSVCQPRPLLADQALRSRARQLRTVVGVTPHVPLSGVATSASRPGLRSSADVEQPKAVPSKRTESARFMDCSDALTPQVGVGLVSCPGRLICQVPVAPAPRPERRAESQAWKKHYTAFTAWQAIIRKHCCDKGSGLGEPAHRRGPPISSTAFFLSATGLGSAGLSALVWRVGAEEDAPRAVCSVGVNVVLTHAEAALDRRSRGFTGLQTVCLSSRGFHPTRVAASGEAPVVGGSEYGQAVAIAASDELNRLGLGLRLRLGLGLGLRLGLRLRPRRSRARLLRGQRPMPPRAARRRRGVGLC
jgi:hypothetical protein